MMTMMSADSPDAYALPNATQLRQRFRIHTRTEIYDDSNTQPGSVAIYTLSDPRDIRDVRYVGQTRAPPVAVFCSTSIMRKSGYPMNFPGG
jgi:hypothetical protein